MGGVPKQPDVARREVDADVAGFHQFESQGGEDICAHACMDDGREVVVTASRRRT